MVHSLDEVTFFPLIRREKALSQVARKDAKAGLESSLIIFLNLIFLAFGLGPQIHFAVIFPGLGRARGSGFADESSLIARSTLASIFVGLVPVTSQIESMNCSAVMRLGTGPEYT